MCFRKLGIIFLIFMQFLLFKKGFSQNYIPMLTNNPEWHVSNCYFGCATDKYYAIGDTVINNLHYHFLDLFHYNKNFVIREDTLSRKVFMRLLSEPSTAKEYKLYDFSLHVNDTTSIQNPGSPFPKYAGSFIVDSIKIKSLVNKLHRFFYLHAIDSVLSNSNSTIWIEGIGSLSLINTPGALPQINGIGQLSCFFNNGLNEYQQLDSIADCVAIYPLTVNEILNENNYELTQNFDLKYIFINSKNKSEFKVQIFDLFGKCIYESKINENNVLKIDCNSFTKGLLLLKIENNLHKAKIFKLINQ
jgi:hypothetical protein